MPIFTNPRPIPLVTPSYRLLNQAGRWWFATPKGEKWWSFSVDCVDRGPRRAEFDSKNPAFSAERLYPSTESWIDQTKQNLRDWGFNSLGGWSDHGTLNQRADGAPLPYFEVLHLGAYARAPFADIFTDGARKAMWGAAEKQVSALRDDPNLVGYFTDNELGWWGDTLFTSYLSLPAGSPGKRRILATLRKVYGGDIARLKRDWITSAKDFSELDRIGKLVLRPNGQGMRAVDAWLRDIGAYYYSFVRNAIRTFDRHHLILGDRYCQFYLLPIVQSSVPYIDAVSTNFGATWNDGTFAKFFLSTLHQVTAKPVVITEFYMGAMENRSGNKNVPAAFPVVQTQTERAQAFARNVHDLATLPYVIGAHWFQYYDEPPKGRGDGENFNHGMVDVWGRPYEEMIAKASAAQPAAVHAATPISAATPSILAVPPAPSAPLTTLKSWPRDSGYVPVAHGIPFADLYVCQDADAVYVGLMAMDYMDEHLYAGGRVPETERAMLEVRVGAMKPPIQVRFGGKDRKASCRQAGVTVGEVPGLTHAVMLRIPRKLIGDLKSSPLRATATTHSRGYRMDWSVHLR